MLRSHFRSYGLLGGMQVLPHKLLRRLSGTAYRRWTHPYLYDFEPLSPRIVFDGVGVARPGSNGSTGRLRDEFLALEGELRGRYADRKLNYPSAFAVTSESSFALYALVRTRRPGVVVETGVANGHSTFFLLHALRANGAGRLFSVDIGADVGVLLEDAERAAWTYVRLRRGRERQDYRAFFAGLPGLDMFVHDSDHTYPWQHFEYETAWGKMGPGAVLLSDDVDHSFAFIDFCKTHGVAPTLLMSGVKVFGVVERSPVV